MIALIMSLLLSSSAWGQGISLLQETRDIECSVTDGDQTLRGLWIDKKDTKLELNYPDQSEEFEQVKFLDRGILAKSKRDESKFLFFQILNNQQLVLHLGRLVELKESDCEDIGAAKKCKSSSLKELIWTPEKLVYNGESEKRNTDIKHYGFFPNKGTYSLGFESRKMKHGYPSLLLLDYGAPVELLVGHSSFLKCNYN